MQLAVSPSPTPSTTQKYSSQSHPMALKPRRAPRASSPTSDAGFPSMLTAAPFSKPTSSSSRPGVIDLTRSRSTSPCPPLAATLESKAPPRSRSPARPFPPPSFSGFTISKTQSAQTPAYLTLPTESPRHPAARATFVLRGDTSDSEHRDDGGDSDDSDHTSVLSGEEFVVPASALRNAGGRVVDAKWEAEVALEEHEPASPVREAPLRRDLEQQAARELRRWHALMEVVHSEAGYVRDLRVLTNVYLPLLSTLPLSMPTLEAARDIASDALALLALHERFVRALEAATAQVAGGASNGSVDKAVQQVGRLFTEESSSFDLYQRFCSVQPDVVRLLRPAQTRAEWVSFERRCAMGDADAEQEQQQTEDKMPAAQNAGDTHVSSKHNSSSSTSAPRPMTLMPSAFKADAPPRRHHSYDSIVGVFGAASSAATRHKSNIARPPPDTRASATSSRLRFHDFLIKPVQRICKYPLMLEGLRSKVLGDATDAVVAVAVGSMRGVAGRVDEARRRRESAVKSKMIVDRIMPHPVITPGFFSSLGDCLLSGSLDVVHHHHSLNPITTPVRVKYFGGFLYVGGYLLLVKVDKSKKYRLKHWFSLARFEIVDISQDTALVSSSFRLSYMDHHFEIAVACQREKDLWLRAIKEARGAPPLWTSEPVSSLQVLHMESPITPPAMDNAVLDTLEFPVPMKRGLSSSSMSDPLAMLRLSSTRFRSTTPNPAATSSPSTKYIFSPTDETTILLHRSSGTNRNFVDRGLADVLSDMVVSLRRQAQARREILFPPPQVSDASQTIAIAAKNKLMRRGSVMMARPRGLTLTTPGAVTDREEEPASPASAALRSKATSTGWKRMSLLPSLSALYAEPEDYDFPKPIMSPTEDVRVLSPPAMTRSLTDDATDRSPLPQSTTIGGDEHGLQYHRRARSLVGSVKGLMRLGSVGSATSQEMSDEWRALGHTGDSVTDNNNNNSSNAGDKSELDCTASTRRRRVSSAPTAPPVSSTNPPIIFPPSSDHQRTVDTSPISPSKTSVILDSAPPASNTSGSKPFRKKSASVPFNHDQSLKPRRSFKNFVFYNRLTSVD